MSGLSAMFLILKKISPPTKFIHCLRQWYWLLSVMHIHSHWKAYNFFSIFKLLCIFVIHYSHQDEDYRSPDGWVISNQSLMIFQFFHATDVQHTIFSLDFNLHELGFPFSQALTKHHCRLLNAFKARNIAHKINKLGSKNRFVQRLWQFEL